MMGLISLVLCVVCLGLCAVMQVKGMKLMSETQSAKKEYLNARIEQSQKLSLQDKFLQECRQELYECRHELAECKLDLKACRQELYECKERISSLEYDNDIIKRKLKIHTEVAKHSKVVIPFKATI